MLKDPKSTNIFENMEDDLNERRPQQKMNSMQDNLNARLQWKLTLMEYKLNEVQHLSQYTFLDFNSLYYLFLLHLNRVIFIHLIILRFSNFIPIFNRNL